MTLKVKKKLVLFDIDGVVADDSHRVHFALDKEWGSYFEALELDKPLQKGFDLAWEYAQRPDVDVQYLTGRRIDLYQRTVSWLIRHRFPNPERITMRGFANRDILAKYKAGVFKNAIEGGEFESVMIHEDDPAVVNYINMKFGDNSAVLIDWYVKNTGMVKVAEA